MAEGDGCPRPDIPSSSRPPSPCLREPILQTERRRLAYSLSSSLQHQSSHCFTNAFALITIVIIFTSFVFLWLTMNKCRVTKLCFYKSRTTGCRPECMGSADCAWLQHHGQRQSFQVHAEMEGDVFSRQSSTLKKKKRVGCSPYESCKALGNLLVPQCAFWFAIIIRRIIIKENTWGAEGKNNKKNV